MEIYVYLVTYLRLQFINSHLQHLVSDNTSHVPDKTILRDFIFLKTETQPKDENAKDFN